MAAFLLFCFYLKWQPFMSRLELPFFVCRRRWRHSCWSGSGRALLAALACLFLLSTRAAARARRTGRARCKGPASLFRTARDDNYFSDMVQWNNRASYLEAVARVAASGCHTVRIDIRENKLEYPFQALLRERDPRVRFTPRRPGLRGVVSRLCRAAGGQRAGLGRPITIGNFLLYFPGRAGE